MGETNSEVIEIIPGREESVWDHPYTWSEVKSLSCVRLFATPWAVAYQDPQSMGFSRQEYWSGLPFPSILMCGIVSKVIDMEKSGDILDLFWKYSKKVLLMGWLWVWGREGGHMECQGFWLNQLEGNSCELRQGFRVAGWREDPEFGCGNSGINLEVRILSYMKWFIVKVMLSNRKSNTYFVMSISFYWVFSEIIHHGQDYINVNCIENSDHSC